MAREIEKTTAITVRNGAFTESWRPARSTIDQAGVGFAGGVQIVGHAAAEAIVTTDVGTLGLAAFQNLDATNYVQIGPDSGGTLIPAIRLLPGETAEIRLVPGTTYKAQANVASVKLKYWILEA